MAPWPPSNKLTASPSLMPSPSPSLSSTTTTATAIDGCEDEAKLLDPSHKMTAEIFGALTGALALREERLRDETRRDEEELAR